MATTSHPLSCALIACALFTLPAWLSAQTWSGSGSNNNFSTATNWSGGSAPVNDGSATAVFTGSQRPFPVLDADYTLNGLKLLGGLNSFTLSGSHSLTINSVLETDTVGFLALTVTAPVILGGDVTATITPSSYYGVIGLRGGVNGAHNLTTTGLGSLYLSGDSAFTTLKVQGGGTARIGSDYSNPGVYATLAANVELSGYSYLGWNTSNDTTFAGAISGTGTFSKSGSAQLTLTGQSTFTGQAAVAHGTVTVGATNALSANASMAISAGGTLDVANSATVHGLSMTGGFMTIASGKALTVNLSGAGGAVDATSTVSGAGGLTLTGSVGNGQLSVDGALNQTGGTVVDGATLQIQGTTGSVAGNVALLNGGRVTFVRSNAYTYDGIISGNGYVVQGGSGLTTLTGQNTYTGLTRLDSGTLVVGAVNALPTNSLVVFSYPTAGTTLRVDQNQTIAGLSSSGGTAANGTVSLSTGKTLTLDFTGSNTFGGNVSGAGALEKAGSGTQILTGDWTHTGGVTISGGELTVGGGGAAGSISGNIVDNSVLAFNRTDTITHAGVISGTGSVVKRNSNTLVLSGANSYSGGTSLSSGVLAIAANSAIGSGTLTFAGGTLRTDAAVTVANNVALSSSGTVNTNGFDAAFNGAFSGTGSFTKTGVGTLTVGGTSTATGAINLSQGGLTIAADNALSTTGLFASQGGTTLNVNANQTLTSASGFSFAGDTSIATGKALTLNITATTGPSLTGAWSGAGSLVKTGTGRLLVLSDNFSPGSVTISNGTVQVGSNGINGVIGSDITNNAALMFSRSNDFTHGNVISGTGTLQKAGLGVLTLTGANTYTGLTSVTEGTLQLSGDSRLTTNAVVSLSSGTTLDVQGNQTLRDLSGSGATVTIATGKALTADFTSSKTISTVTGAGSFVKTGASSVTITTLTAAGGTTISQGSVSTGNLSGNVLNNGSLTISNASALTYSDVISGSGNVTKSGAGTLTLTTANTFGGTLALSGGRVVASAANALSGGAVTMVSGAQLEVAANQTISGLIATNPSSVVQINSGASLTVNTPTSNSITAQLSGSGTFVKQGSGNLNFNNPSANTFDGQLKVQGGMLRIAGTYSSADAVVSSGGQLRGTGFIRDVAVGTGGEISAGATLGTGTFTMGSLTLAGGSRLVVDMMDATGTAGQLNGGWDLLTISGVLDFNASAGSRVILDLQSLSGSATLGAAFNFVDASSSAWRIASASGGIVDFSANYFTVDTTDFANPFSGTFSVGQVGNDLFLNYSAVSAIPEPSTYAILVGTATLGLAVWRKRQAGKTVRSNS